MTPSPSGTRRRRGQHPVGLTEPEPSRDQHWLRFSLMRFARMHRIASILLLAIVPICVGGCSVFVASQGKKLDKIFTDSATKETVQREFGAPCHSGTYEPPLRLSEIPDV